MKVEFDYVSLTIIVTTQLIERRANEIRGQSLCHCETEENDAIM